MRDPRLARIPAILVAAAAALVVALIGGSLTDVGAWYQALAKPAWNPPDWAFGVIWTAIFALCAVSGVVAWRAARTVRPEWIVGVFALNGALNILWSLLFFRLRRPDWALEEVGLFWLSIAILVVFLWRISRVAGALIAPYLIWVTIATVLNYEIVRLNGPFGTG